MTESFQDDVLVFEEFKEYNIAYPVIVTRWEIKQVHGLNKQYLQVYFQKLNNNVKAFQLNITGYTDFGKTERLSDITIQEVDKKEIEFSEVIPLNIEGRKVEIVICQCLMTDGSIIEKHDRQMVVNTFKPFAEEDRAAGKRLLSNAIGYPIDNITHWYCACGALHNSEADSCERCQESKQEIFALFTSENIRKEQEKLTEIERKNSSRTEIRGIVHGWILFLTAVFMLIPMISYEALFPELKVQFGSNSAFNGWMIPLLVLTLALFTVCLIGRLLRLKISKKIEFATMIAYIIVNVAIVVVSWSFGVYTVGNLEYGVYGGYLWFCFALTLLTAPLAIAYFICYSDKAFNKICKLIESKQGK